MAFLGATACQGEAPFQGSPERRSAAIIDGEVDQEHPAVFALVSHVERGVGVCTGTLIAPNLVLTARHCVSEGLAGVIECGAAPLGDPLDADGVFVTNDTTVSGSSIWFQARSVHVPPDGDDTCGFDIALVALVSNGLPRDTAVPLVPRIDLPIARGEEYAAVGYGLTTPDDEGDSGTRMQLEGLRAPCTPGGCGFGVEDTEFRGDTGVCDGDSGGPALDADERIMGVVSRGSEGCELPVYASVASWGDWMRGVAEALADESGYDPPPWVTTGSSEPSENGSGGESSTSSGGQAGTGATGARAGSVQGRPCSTDDPCGTGHGCYYERDPADAYCAAYCDGPGVCASGLSCDPNVGVCTSAEGGNLDPESSGGCSIHPVPTRAPPWLLLAFVLPLLVTRRSLSHRLVPS